ncbi:unnamed protein product [Brassica oleracea var. botrytis]|uniref:(rape) hypothetical protein n=1 Tax=Brassica napus TaxID=3708 RepID=A0A816JPX3_BRANA|nr:unnamed protein product [Brassica napus]
MLFTKHVTISSLISRVNNTERRCLELCPWTTVSLDIFAQFAITPPTTNSTCPSITKAKIIITSWLIKSSLLKQRLARAGREIHKWISLTR